MPARWINGSSNSWGSTPTPSSSNSPPAGGDGEILDWILANGKNKHSDAEVLGWSAHQEQRVPTDPDTRNFFNDIHAKAAPQREDIATWFDLLDVDDYVSFGGKA